MGRVMAHACNDPGFSKTSAGSLVGLTLIFHSELENRQALRLSKAKFFCQKQGALMLSEHVFLEGEAINFFLGVGREKR